jgi:hypothetical protein
MEARQTEVEARFIVQDGIDSRIADLGGLMKREVTFTDYYYDTKDWKLTLEDFWVRRRDTLWQLKYPPASGRSAQNTPCAQYDETEDEQEICRLVSPLLSSSDVAPQDVAALMAESGCKAFSEYITTRRSYVFPQEHNVSVDMDVTDFGYQVGEIETLTTGSTGAAVRVVDEFAAKLGWFVSRELNTAAKASAQIWMCR